MFGYRVPDADEVMLVSGGKSKDDNGHPLQFKIVRGAKFVFPGFRKVAFLSLAQRKARIEEPCLTTQGLQVKLTAAIAFKIGRDDASIYAAGERFRDDQQRDDAMSNQTGGIFAGHLRAIAGDMTFEDIMRNRQELADKVLASSKTEVGNMGLLIDSFQITDLSENSGYIDALSAPQRAAVQQAAAIAQSKANQAAAEAEQESQRNQAEYQRQTMVAKAQMQAEVDAESQKSSQAGPLAAAKAQQEVLTEQTQLAARQADLRRAQLQTDQVRPAEAAAQVVKIQAQAEADRTTIQADADAHKMTVQAAALAAEGKVTIDRMLVEQLPQLVTAASQTLRGANVTLFNGAEGANQLITAAVGQGMSVYQTLRDSLARAADSNDIAAIEQMANSSSKE